MPGIVEYPYSVAVCLKWYSHNLQTLLGYRIILGTLNSAIQNQNFLEFAVSDVEDWGGETQKPGELLYTNQYIIIYLTLPMTKLNQSETNKKCDFCKSFI